MAISMEVDVAILQLVFFVPALFLSIWLWVRYGFRLGAGAWRLTLVLALLRIIAGSCAIAAETYPSDGLYATVLSCDLVGTAPLFLLTLRLIERVNHTYQKIPTPLFRLADVLSLVGLALGIVGANQALTAVGSGKPFSVSPYMVASLSLFIVIIAINVLSEAVLLVTAMSGPRRLVQHSHQTGARSKSGSVDCCAATAAGGGGGGGPNNNHNRDVDVEHAPTNTTTSSSGGEHAAARTILLGVACAIPFLIVRATFAAIGDFRNDVRFIPYLGNTAVYLGMSVVMEIVATYICLGIGFAVPPPLPPPITANVAAMGEERKSGMMAGNGRLRMRERRGGGLLGLGLLPRRR